MKKIPHALKFTAVLTCIVLLLTVSFFDLIDWVIPGDFPNWVYVADLAAHAVLILNALVAFVIEYRKKHMSENKD